MQLLLYVKFDFSTSPLVPPTLALPGKKKKKEKHL